MPGKEVEPTVLPLKQSQNAKLKEVEDKGYIHPLQSANVLFKFIDKIDYLKEALKYKAIMPRYYEEMLSYIQIKYEKIVFPMSCFCDIPLNKLVPHMQNYGDYGIGLNKQWGIGRGIQPIQYINPSSSLISDYKVAFSKSCETSGKDKTIVSDYSNYLLTNLLFMKPIEGPMLKDNEYIEMNFHDEREWRFVPDMNNINTELPLLIPQKHIDRYLNLNAYKTYSDAIKKCPDSWLKFQYNDVKYLIVKTDAERKDFIRFIKSKDIKARVIEKDILISKILVFDELKEDW